MFRTAHGNGSCSAHNGLNTPDREILCDVELVHSKAKHFHEKEIAGGAVQGTCKAVQVVRWHSLQERHKMAFWMMMLRLAFRTGPFQSFYVEWDTSKCITTCFMLLKSH